MSQPVSHYANLGAYNTLSPGATQRPVAVAGTINDIRIIPEFGSCGNNVLSHSLGNGNMNNGYFNLCAAYPGCSHKCSIPYMDQLCPNKQNNYSNVQNQLQNERTQAVKKLQNQLAASEGSVDLE